MILFANITRDHFITCTYSHDESLNLFVYHFASFQVKMAALLAFLHQSSSVVWLTTLTLNRFSSAFIDHSLRDLDYRDKLLFEHILNMGLKDLPPPDKAIFYNDNGRSLNSVLLYGHEWTLMLFDLLTFAFVDSLAQDFVLAGVVTYLVAKILIIFRNKFGRKNITIKTLVDERFLI